MKKLYTLLLLMLFATTLTIAQKTADIFIENPTVTGNKYSWEIHITPTNDWGTGNRKALGDCSWFFDYNSAALSNPVLTFVAPQVAPASGYTNTTGLAGGAGEKVQATTDLDFDNFDGVNLDMGTKYHIYTIEMDITDAGQQAQVTWDQINTGIFNAPDNEITTIYNGSGDVPLPVELSSFSATNQKGNAVNLQWETATEVNNYGFEVERASFQKDGTTPRQDYEWEKISFVEGAGNSNSSKTYSFVDKNPVGGTSFAYRLKQIDIDGTFEYSDLVEVEILPTEYELYQNYPNPFNPSTKIKFSLPEDAKVAVDIYNMLGQRVMTLFNKNMKAGYHQVLFDTQSAGTQLASGVYIYTISTKNFSSVKKMVLLK